MSVFKICKTVPVNELRQLESQNNVIMRLKTIYLMFMVKPQTSDIRMTSGLKEKHC